MADRGKEKLNGYLNQLIADLKNAQDGISEIKAKMADGSAKPSDVSHCFMTLSGFMEDFSQEINGFLEDRSPHHETTAVARQENVTQAATPKQTSSSTIAESGAYDHRFNKVLERVSTLEKLHAETSLLTLENQKSQSQFSHHLESVQNNQEHFQTKVHLLSKAIYGQKEEEGQAVMDLPMMCDQLERLKTDVFKGDNITQQLQKKVKGIEGKHPKILESIQNKIGELHEETQSTKAELQSTKSDVTQVKKLVQEHRESLKETETRMIERVSSVKTNMNRKCDSFDAEIKDLVKLRKVLNQHHLRAQKKEEQQLPVLESIQENVIELQRKTRSFKQELQKTQSDVTAVKKQQQKHKRTCSDTETRTNQQMTQIKTKADKLTTRINDAEKLKDENNIFFKATIHSKSRELQKGAILDDTLGTGINVGNGFQPNGTFKVPINGRYFVNLNFYQGDSGEAELAVVCNGEGTASGLAIRTTGPNDKRTTASVLELKKGDEIGVKVWDIENQPKICQCVLAGFRIG